MSTDDLHVDPDVLRKAFRQAMGHVAAAVSVVTVFHEGAPHGTTVSAFSSLSMEPPMLLVSLDRRSNLLAKIGLGTRLGVNVLAAHHDQIALRFAGKGDDKFLDVPWQLQDGVPALVDRHAWVSLEIVQLVPAGDHVVVFGSVRSADVTASAPLTYWQRTFGTHHTF